MRILSSVVYRLPFIVWSFLVAQTNTSTGLKKPSHINGPWLDNSFQHRRNTPYHTFGKMSDSGPPSPSDLWVFVDEDAKGLNDAAFAVGMDVPRWLDAPGTYHNFGCGFAFADGHSETHHWLYHNEKIIGDITNPQDKADWSWLAAHTSARMQ